MLRSNSLNTAEHLKHRFAGRGCCVDRLLVQHQVCVRAVTGPAVCPLLSTNSRSPVLPATKVASSVMPAKPRDRLMATPRQLPTGSALHFPPTPLPANSGLPISSTNASPSADMILGGSISAPAIARRRHGIAAHGWRFPPRAVSRPPRCAGFGCPWSARRSKRGVQRGTLGLHGWQRSTAEQQLRFALTAIVPISPHLSRRGRARLARPLPCVLKARCSSPLTSRYPRSL